MSRTAITEVRTVAVAVTDQERALRFYVDQLGFEKRVDAPLGDGSRWIEVAPPGAAVSISLTSASPSSPAGLDTGVRLLTADAVGDHERMERHGIDTDDVLRWRDMPPMFSFRDLDGNILYVIEMEGTQT